MLTQNPSLLEHTIWCELQGDAGEPHVPLREGCVADGQNSMMSKDIAGIWVGYLENNPVLFSPFTVWEDITVEDDAFAKNGEKLGVEIQIPLLTFKTVSPSYIISTYQERDRQTLTLKEL